MAASLAQRSSQRERNGRVNQIWRIVIINHGVAKWQLQPSAAAKLTVMAAGAWRKYQQQLAMHQRSLQRSAGSARRNGAVGGGVMAASAAAAWLVSRRQQQLALKASANWRLQRISVKTAKAMPLSRSGETAYLQLNGGGVAKAAAIMAALSAAKSAGKAAALAAAPKAAKSAKA
jgi:hypothetical protein